MTPLDLVNHGEVTNHDFVRDLQKMLVGSLPIKIIAITMRVKYLIATLGPATQM